VYCTAEILKMAAPHLRRGAMPRQAGRLFTHHTLTYVRPTRCSTRNPAGVRRFAQEQLAPTPPLDGKSTFQEALKGLAAMALWRRIAEKWTAPGSTTLACRGVRGDRCGDCSTATSLP